MAMLIQPAVVLRLWDYSETSQIVALLTPEYGRVRLLAKGIRRGAKNRFAPGLDLLEFGEVRFRLPRGDSELSTLTDWRQRESFPRIRLELLRLYSGLYAAELSSVLTEELDPHPRLFAALVALLGELNGDVGEAAGGKNGVVGAWVVRFQAELLRAIGYAPSFQRCMNCGNDRQPGTPVWFSASSGGLLCAACHINHQEGVSVPAALFDTPQDVPQPILWFRLLDYYLTHLAGRKLRCGARLGEMLENEPPSPSGATGS